MKLTTVEGMRSEIFVPLTPKPIFTELKKPLNKCKVAFITAGGIHKKDQKPFNTSGDFSYRTIEFDTPSDQLMVTHGGFDNSDINKDVNAMFPIDRLHELVKEGFIGSLPKETYTFMGGGGNVEKFTNETGPEIERTGCRHRSLHRRLRYMPPFGHDCYALLRSGRYELLRYRRIAPDCSSTGCASYYGSSCAHRLQCR